MRRISVFNNVSVDGYFASASGSMDWAYPSAEAAQDPEWQAFVAGNASGNGELLFGRVTYDEMAAFWPTPVAAQQMPAVARGMNEMAKTVISRTMKSADWKNTTVATDLLATAERLRSQDGPGVTILGSGSVTAQLAQAGLIDEFQIVVCPIALGAGRTLFEAVTAPVALTRTSTRAFNNGRVFSVYQVRH